MSNLLDLSNLACLGNNLVLVRAWAPCRIRNSSILESHSCGQPPTSSRHCHLGTIHFPRRTRDHHTHSQMDSSTL